MDLQVGGTSKFRVEKNGTVYLGGVKLQADFSGAGRILIGSSSTGGLFINPNTQVTWSGASALGWVPGTDFGVVPDVTLYRDAANTLALRNGTNAQAFN